MSEFIQLQIHRTQVHAEIKLSCWNMIYVSRDRDEKENWNAEKLSSFLSMFYMGE